MKNKYLLSYLSEFYQDPKFDKMLDYFKMNLDWYLYDYGLQTVCSTECKMSHMYKTQKISLYKRVVSGVINIFRRIKRLIFRCHFNVIKKTDELIFPGVPRKIMSFSNIPIEAKKKFASANFEVVSFDEIKETNKVIRSLCKWISELDEIPFNQRLDIKQYDILSTYFSELKVLFKDYAALFSPTDEFFLHKFFIDVFKSNGISTFIFLHGLPGIYTITENNRADYLLVWGTVLRDKFIECGHSPKKVLATGRMGYDYIPHPKILRNSLDNVLVMTSATICSQQKGWNWYDFPKQDRTLLLTYIYSVEHVLKNNGVRHARLRPHPINNIDWVKHFIDTDFYILDVDDLYESLNKSTIVIGPTSTTFLETIMNGVNYIVYEPNMLDTQLVPPFDGSEELLEVAHNEEELMRLIKNRYSTTSEILDKYIQPFSVDKIVNLI